MMCDTYEAKCALADKSSLSWLNKLRGISLLGILQECGETRKRDALGSISPREKRNLVGYL
jgi:hypothetical protein